MQHLDYTATYGYCKERLSMIFRFTHLSNGILFFCRNQPLADCFHPFGFFLRKIIQKIITSFPAPVQMIPTYFRINPFNILPQFSGRHKQTSLASNNDLLQAIRCSHSHSVSSSNIMGRFLNILIGCFCFPGKDHIDIMPSRHFTRKSFHFIGIKHKNHFHLSIPLIIGKNIHQFAACRIHTMF